MYCDFRKISVYRSIIAGYILRIATLLLQTKDRDDHKGLSRPVIINEPRYACN